MTSIVVVETKNSIIMGSDTQATSYRKISMRESKIVRNGIYSVGIAGDSRMAHALKDAKIPEPFSDDLGFFMRTRFKDFLASLAEKSGVQPNAWEAIVVIHDQVFCFRGGSIWDADRSGITVIGSGSPWLEGSLYSLKPSKITKKDVLNALESAARNDPHTSGPFHIEVLPKGR